MAKARILVVEDELNLLEGIKTVLEIDGFEVTTAENGKQALAALHDAARSGTGALPELIVSDIMMPHMDGIDLLRAVRTEQQWINIPFIFLTARGEKVDVQRGKQLGVDDYLVKPFDPQELLVAVESRINRHRALESAHSSQMSDIKRNILMILNHEFRTPLTFVVAYADMLNDHENVHLSDEDLLTFLKGVNTGAVRLRRLIENFITLVEFEMGEAERSYVLRRTSITDLPRLIEAAKISVYTDETLNPLEIDVPPDFPRFDADPVYLQFAIAQLIDNAVKFSEPDKPVRVEAANEGDSISIRVIDYGRGIPEYERVHIWESFYQVNREEFEDQGSGSGLTIVKEIVDLHRGSVSCESVQGEGSTFTMYFPFKSQ